MSQIIKSSLALGLLLSLSLFSLSGCGDTNSQADLNPVTGKHPSGWLPVGHKLTANSHILTCTECHGDDFTGGISKIACTQCHLGNQLEVHPFLLWGNFTYALHGGHVTLKDPTASSCMPCHGSDLKGAGTSPSCTICHLGGSAFSAHPAGWNTAVDFATGNPLHGQFVGNSGTASCRTTVCHGTNLQGVFLSGPSCNACHNFPL